MIRNTSLNAIELQTILTEIEGILNSHPLTYPYTDINDGPPLTPSHFLYGYRLLTLPDTEEDSDYIPRESAKDLTRRAKYHQKTMQAFWKQWQGILNRSQQTTFITKEQKHIKRASGSR